MKRYFKLTVLMLIAISISFSGCTKKEPAPAVSQEAAPQAVELPVLEQNTMYQNNQPEWAKNPDTSFTNGPEKLQQSSEEDKLFAEPAGD